MRAYVCYKGGIFPQGPGDGDCLFLKDDRGRLWACFPAPVEGDDLLANAALAVGWLRERLRSCGLPFDFRRARLESAQGVEELRRRLARRPAPTPADPVAPSRLLAEES